MFSHDVTAAILVSQTMKWRPCWCPKPILWKLNSFLMQTLSFVPINLHRRWPHEWKHSILKYLSYTYSQSMFVANLRLGCYSLFSNPQNQLCLTPPSPPPTQHRSYCFQMLLKYTVPSRIACVAGVKRGRGNLGARGRKERNACKGAISRLHSHATLLPTS